MPGQQCPRGSHQTGDIDVPDDEDRIDGSDEEDHSGSIGQQRLGGLLDYLETIGASSHCADYQPHKPNPEEDPHDDQDRLDDQDGGSLQGFAEIQPVGGENQPDKCDRRKDGTVDEVDKLVVELGF